MVQHSLGIPDPSQRKTEIEAQVKRGYLERLDQKIPSLRRLYTQRQWVSLKTELTQVKRSAITHGLKQLSQAAEAAEATLPQKLGKSRFADRPVNSSHTHSAVAKLMREMNNLVIQLD